MGIALVSFSKYPSYQDACVNMAKCLNEDLSVKSSAVIDRESVFANVDTKNIMVVNAPEKNGICKGLFRLNEVIKVIRWLNKNQIQNVFLESVHLWNIPLMVLCPNKNYVVAVHDVSPHCGDKHAGMLSKIYEFYTKKAKSIVIRNKKDTEKFKKIYPNSKARIDYLPLCFTFGEYQDTEKTNKVLFFGRINNYKGIDILKVIAEKMADVEFIVCGKPTEDMQKLVFECSKVENITINTNFIPYEEMEKYFRDCSCVVLPYKSATQSGVVTDAYRFGKPVVAFEVGALGEQIINGKTGYLIEPGNIEAFCNGIEEILQMDNISYRDMSSAAYKFGVEQYSFQSASKRLLNIISKGE